LAGESQSWLLVPTVFLLILETESAAVVVGAVDIVESELVARSARRGKSIGKPLVNIDLSATKLLETRRPDRSPPPVFR
jgi:hypothetical protein